MQKKEFDIVPDRRAISEINRELRFRPSPVDSPRTLTTSQVEAFNRDGCLTGIRVFDGEEVRSNRLYFDRLLKETLAAGGDSYSISTAHLQHGRAYDLLTEPRTVACVKDLLGADVIAWGCHFFCKMPRDGKAVSYHQDASYWPLTPSGTVTVWLAIDDADVENGCMRCIPGSHRFGDLEYRQSDADENNVLDQTVDDAERFGSAIDVELEAGEISIHSDLLLHGSSPNTSDRRRCGLTLRYCPAHVRAGMDWNAKGVVVNGSDPSGHWANPSRPSSD